MSMAGWLALVLCVIGGYFIVVAKFRQKGRSEMTPEEMKIFLRGYFLFLIGSCLGIVLGLTHCMPYFS